MCDHQRGNHDLYEFGFRHSKFNWMFAIRQEFGNLEAIAVGNRGHSLEFHIRPVEMETRGSWFLFVIGEIDRRIDAFEDDCMKKCGA